MNKWFIGIGLSLALVACPAVPTIESVKIKSAFNTVAATETTNLAIEVKGSGAFDARVDWSIVPSLGSVTAQSETQAIYTAPLVSSDTNIVIRATSKLDPSKFGETTIQIKAPTITSLTATPSKTTLESEETTSISAKLEGTGAFNTDVLWSVVSGGGSLSSGTGNPVNYTSPKVGVDTDVVLQATAVGDNSKKQNVSLKVLTAKIITGITLEATPRSIPSATGTSNITATVNGTGAILNAVTWEIVSGGGNLINPTDTNVTYTAPTVSVDTIVTIKATSKANPSQSATITLSVVIPPVVSGINLTATPNSIVATTGVSTISSTIIGSGSIQNAVTWEIVSGGGTLSNATDTSVTFTAPNVTVETIVTIRATSKTDSSKTATTTITVTIPTVVSGITLSATARTIASGTGSSTISAVITGSGTFQNAVTWEIASGGGTLSNSTDTSVTYTAPSIVQDTIATLKATSKTDLSKTDTISLIVIAPTVVNSVQVTSTPSIIKSNATTTLSAVISGTGNPNPNAKWEIVSGGGALSSVSGASVTYAPAVVTTDTNVVIKATSSDDASKSASKTVVVEPIPTITGISVSMPFTTVQANGSIALGASITGYGNPDLSVKWSVVGNQGTLTNTTGAATTLNAPNVTAQTKIQIKAESVQDSSKSTLTEITINPKPPIEVITTPASVSVNATQAVAISAVVNYAQNASVAWTSSIGILTPNGNSAIWKAPNVLVDTTATITATSIEDSSKKTTISVNIKAAVIEVYALPLHPAYNDAGFNFGTGVSPASIAVAYGIHFHLAARANGESIGGTWAVGNAGIVQLMSTNTTNGSANVARFVGRGIGQSSTVTFTAPGGQQRQIQANIGAIEPKRLPTACANGDGGYVAIRPDGRYVISGNLNGLGLPNISGVVSETILGSATSRTLRGCITGINTITLLTTDPSVSYTSGEFNLTGSNLQALTETRHCPILSVQQKYYTGHLVCQDRTGLAWGANYNGQFGADLPLDGTKRALRSNGGSGFAWITTTEQYSVGMQWNGAAWATGNWFHNWADNGGTGDSRNWEYVPVLNSMVSCDIDNELTVCIPPERTQLIIHGVGTSGNRTGKLHYRPEAFAIPTGEIAVAVAVGQESILLLTETGVYRRGVLGISPTQPSCGCWERVSNITGTPVEIAATKAWYIIKTTDGAYRNTNGNSGFMPMNAVNPDATFVVEPPSVNLLQRVMSVAQISLAGFSNNEFYVASQDSSVETEIGNWINGKRELRLHCTKSGVSTNVIITHKIFPNITKAIPVTCTGNQNPRIVRFYERNNNINPKPWDSLKLQWQIEEPEGQSMTCKLDLDGNGTWDHTQSNCNDSLDYSHVWNNTQSGAQNIKLRVEDTYGGAAEVYLGFTVQSTNKAPVISSFTVTPSSGTAPITVTYNWSVSDPDNDPTTCQLDTNGDGTYEYSYPCSSRNSQTHTFNNNGSYTSRIRVTDGRGGEFSASRVVSLSEAIVPQPLNVIFDASGLSGLISINVQTSDQSATCILFIAVPYQKRIVPCNTSDYIIEVDARSYDLALSIYNSTSSKIVVKNVNVTTSQQEEFSATQNMPLVNLGVPENIDLNKLSICLSKSFFLELIESLLLVQEIKTGRSYDFQNYSSQILAAAAESPSALDQAYLDIIKEIGFDFAVSETKLKILDLRTGAAKLAAGKLLNYNTFTKWGRNAFRSVGPTLRVGAGKIFIGITVVKVSFEAGRCYAS